MPWVELLVFSQMPGSRSKFRVCPFWGMSDNSTRSSALTYFKGSMVCTPMIGLPRRHLLLARGSNRTYSTHHKYTSRPTPKTLQIFRFQNMQYHSMGAIFITL